MIPLTAKELEDLGQGAPQEIMVATAVFNGDKVLLGEDRKKNAFIIPSGRLRGGEAQEDCAVSTVREESGVVCENPRVISIYNDYRKDEHMHHVTIGMIADYQSGDVNNPWGWHLPEHVLRLNLSKTDKILMEHFLYFWFGETR